MNIKKDVTYPLGQVGCTDIVKMQIEGIKTVRRMSQGSTKHFKKILFNFSFSSFNFFFHYRL